MGIGALVGGCSPSPDPALLPDSVLRAELGLTDADRVHRITLSGGSAEQVAPDSVLVTVGDWVEFVASDWRIHEIRFDAAGLGPEARTFLEGSDQVASPPLMAPDARFVVSFRGAPEGRYPFRVEGNGAAGGGVVVVGSSR